MSATADTSHTNNYGPLASYKKKLALNSKYGYHGSDCEETKEDAISKEGKKRVIEQESKSWTSFYCLARAKEIKG